MSVTIINSVYWDKDVKYIEQANYQDGTIAFYNIWRKAELNSIVDHNTVAVWHIKYKS